jgi:hypothetical protein
MPRVGFLTLPVDTGWDERLSGVVGGRRHVGKVEDHVTNLPEEIVLVHVPVHTGTVWVCLMGNVRVCINQRDACKGRASLDDGAVVGVADELGVVVLDDGRTD